MPEPMGVAVHDTGPSPARLLHAVPALHELADPASYLARHSRSFRFATMLLPAADRARIARVYTWCRFTDDLVDRATGTAAEVDARLDAWFACSRAAYEGRSSGIALVDRVMGEAAELGVPFDYPAALVDGVRSDLHFAPFPDEAALRRYCDRVAGVVGRWLTELHGVHDGWTLDRAAALGHAMQLTNILRDVGEDWDQGRVYVPLTMLARHGLCAEDIGRLRRGEREVDAAYRALLEELMATAERGYAAAREALPALPRGFRHSVAVAAAVYEGIHDEIRRNGHDNVRRRAATTARRKLELAMGVLGGGRGRSASIRPGKGGGGKGEALSGRLVSPG